MQFVDLSQARLEWPKTRISGFKSHLFEIIVSLGGGNILNVTATRYCIYWSSPWSGKPPHRDRPTSKNTIGTRYITNLHLFTFQNIRSICSELWSFYNHKYYCFPFIVTAEIAGVLPMERSWPYLLHHLCTLENPIIETLHVDSPFSYDVL